MDAKNQETQIALSDLWVIFKQSLSKIACITLATVLALSAYLFSKPPMYTAEAQFLEKNDSSNAANSIKDMLFSSKSTSNADSIMQSKVILEPLTKKLQLQASINKTRKNYFQNSKDNLKILYSQIFGRDRSRLLLEDPDIDVICEDLRFDGEFPQNYRLDFISSQEFKIIHPQKGLIRTAKLGELQNLENENTSFCLKSTKDLSGQTFSLSLSPLESTVQSLKKNIQIKPSITNANILEIRYANQNRHLAAKLVNTLMEIYHEHITAENERQTNQQLQYLHKRQKQGQDDLETVMHAHGQYLAENLGAGGFKDIESEAEFLSSHQSEWNTRVWELKLELQLLKKATKNPETFFKLDSFNLGNGKDIRNINELITRIRDLSSQQKQIKELLETTSAHLSMEERERLESRLFIAKDNLKIYIDSHKKSVEEQITAIESQIQALNYQVSSLPQKWIVEHKLELQERMHEKMMEKLSELVENTILTHNLESIESKPLEIAQTPVDPQMPSFFLLLMATFLFSSFTSCLFFFSKAYLRGVQASPENLNLAGYDVTGRLKLSKRSQSLSDYDAQDLQTLRQISSSLNKKTKTLLLSHQKEKAFAQEIKMLLELRGEKVLVIKIPKNGKKTAAIKNSLLEYLDDEEKAFPQGSLIEAGGQSPFIAERILSKRFSKALEEVQERFDRILLEIEASAKSLETYNLAKYCDALFLQLKQETLQELENIQELSLKKKKSLSFIF